METNTKTEKINKVETPKKQGNVYAIKRFKEAVTTIAETDLITEEEAIMLERMAIRIAFKYMGMEDPNKK